MRDRHKGGHEFDFDTDVCVKCGMTRPYFDDHGEPRCPGKKPDRSHDEPLEVPDDI